MKLLYLLVIKVLTKPLKMIGFKLIPPGLYPGVCKISNIFSHRIMIISASTVISRLTGYSKMNKGPMGHIMHLRKQFKSINTNVYHNVD